jgi:hypothetical protein
MWMEEVVVSIHPRLIIWFLNNLVFTVWGCKSHAQPPTWRTRISLFVWLLPLNLSGMGVPTISYATAGIALRVSGTLKPHHHDKVETPSVVRYQTSMTNMRNLSRVNPCYEGLTEGDRVSGIADVLCNRVEGYSRKCTVGYITNRNTQREYTKCSYIGIPFLLF